MSFRFLLYSTWVQNIIIFFKARTQPIIVNATAEMLKEHILPVAEKLSQNAKDVSHEEDMYMHEKRMKGAAAEGDDNTVQAVKCTIHYTYIIVCSIGIIISGVGQSSTTLKSVPFGYQMVNGCFRVDSICTS